MTNKIPEGFATVTPTLIVNGASDAIALYTKALGAKELYRMPAPDGSGKIMHACIMIGNSKVFLADATPNCGAPAQSYFYVYFDDVDASFTQAKKAGFEEKMAPQDMFWGDRMGSLADKFGMHWTLATHVRDVSDAEMKEGAKKMAQSKAA